MKRTIPAVLAGLTVASLAYASASALTVDAKPIQAGSDTVTCDPDGVRVRWGLEVDDNSVRNVKVDGIHEDCSNAGAELFVAVDGKRVPGDGVAITDDIVTISFDEANWLTPETINNVKVWIG